MLDEFTFNLYLIRHGRSVINEDPDATGQTTTTPLSSTGEAQAHLLGKRLFKEDLDLEFVYSSNELRAWKTAKIALGDYVVIKTDASLREKESGAWVGGRKSKLITNLVRIKMGNHGGFFRAPQGESNNMVERRTVAFIEDNFLHNEKFIAHCQSMREPVDVVIFSHGVAIKSILHNIMGFDQNFLWKIDIENTSITKLRFDKNGWWLKYLNDYSHLRQDGSLVG